MLPGTQAKSRPAQPRELPVRQSVQYCPGQCSRVSCNLHDITCTDRTREAPCTDHKVSEMTEMLLRFSNIQTGCSQRNTYPPSSHATQLQPLVLRPEPVCRRWRQHRTAGPALAAPSPRQVAVASSSDWSPAQPSASSYDWHVSSGAGSYADPRLAPGYRPPQPASYPSSHQPGGQQHAEAGPFQPSSSFDGSQVRI